MWRQWRDAIRLNRKRTNVIYRSQFPKQQKKTIRIARAFVYTLLLADRANRLVLRKSHRSSSPAIQPLWSWFVFASRKTCPPDRRRRIPVGLRRLIQQWLRFRLLPIVRTNQSWKSNTIISIRLQFYASNVRAYVTGVANSNIITTT